LYLGATIGAVDGFIVVFIGMLFAYASGPTYEGLANFATAIFLATSLSPFGVIYGAAICAILSLAVRPLFPSILIWKNFVRLALWVLSGAAVGAAFSFVVTVLIGHDDWTPFTYFWFHVPPGSSHEFVYLGPRLLIVCGVAFGLLGGLLRDRTLVRHA
jgi:hypothetical protein